MLESQFSLLCRAQKPTRRVAFWVVLAGAVLSAGPVAAAPGGVPGKPASSPGNGTANGHGNDTTSSTTATGASSSSKSKGGQAPPGNNGHIKIDKYDMDGGGNEPHVACGFSVSFFGYDAGNQQASITLTPHAPTRGGHAVTVTTSWQTARRTGNQLDKNVQIAPSTIADAFSGVKPHKQGYHARVDVHVTGSQGADAKHKMLWISPCRPASTTTSTAAPTTTTAQPTTTTSSTTTTTAAPVSGNAAGAAAGASATRAKPTEPKVGATGGPGAGHTAATGAAATTQAPPAGAVSGGAAFTG